MATTKPKHQANFSLVNLKEYILFLAGCDALAPVLTDSEKEELEVISLRLRALRQEMAARLKDAGYTSLEVRDWTQLSPERFHQLVREGHAGRRLAEARKKALRKPVARRKSLSRELKHRTLESIGLSKRIANNLAVSEYRVRTLEQLLALTATDIRGIPNCASGTVKAIEAALVPLGLKLKPA